MSARTGLPWRRIAALKALAIALVVFVHSPVYASVANVLTPLNIGVPLFLFIQAFVVFAKLSSGERRVGSYYAMPAVGRMMLRIVLPWAAAVIAFAALGFRYEHATEAVWNLGAFGPGSYYLMLYLVSYFALPAIWLGLRACGGSFLLAGLAAAVAAEILYPLALEGLRNDALVYRCTPVRYLGVFVLAYASARDFLKPAEERLPRAALLGCAAAGLAAAVIGSLFPSARLPMPADYGWWVCHVPYYLFSCGLAHLALTSEGFERGAGWLAPLGNFTWQIFLLQMVIYACLAR